MDKLFTTVKARLTDSDFVDRAFPMLVEWGVRDEAVLVHSLGCSLWNTLGHELGRMAVVEAPAPAGSGSDIRSDSAWFNKATGLPEVLVEFERYDGSSHCKDKLAEKMANLMEAYHRWDDTPKLLVLSSWSQGIVSAPDVTRLQSLFAKGVENSKGIFLPGIHNARLVFNRFHFQEQGNSLLRLQNIRFQGGI